MSLGGSTVQAHAGVHVLTNRVLWDAITVCITGYPGAVADFFHSSSAAACKDKLESAKQMLAPATARVVGHLSRRGELVHLAIAANDTAMLDTLHRLSTHAQYQRDAKLCFHKAMRCAVVCNSVRMLEHIVKLKQEGGDDDDDGSGDTSHQVAWEPNLMTIALMRDDPDPRMFDWLVAHLPRTSYALTHKSMVFHVERGDLATVQWLHSHGRKISRAVMDIAAKSNHVQVLQYLYDHSDKRCSWDGANDTAARGHVDVVRLIVARKKRHRHRSMVTMAAKNGRLELIQFFLEHPEYNTTEHMRHAINYAAQCGHVDVVRHLHEHCADNGSTVYSIISAASSGHFDVVKYLHENRPSECGPFAIGRAAERRHFEVVQYLQENSHETCEHICEPCSFDAAACNGDLEMVKYLHEHRTEGCTPLALTGAARKGHADVVAFLVEHRTEGDVIKALEAAAQHGHLAVVELLHRHLKPGDSTLCALYAAKFSQHHEVARFLRERQAHESTDAHSQPRSSSGSR